MFMCHAEALNTPRSPQWQEHRSSLRYHWLLNKPHISDDIDPCCSFYEGYLRLF